MKKLTVICLALSAGILAGCSYIAPTDQDLIARNIGESSIIGHKDAINDFFPSPYGPQKISISFVGTPKFQGFEGNQITWTLQGHYNIDLPPYTSSSNFTATLTGPYNINDNQASTSPQSVESIVFYDIGDMNLRGVRDAVKGVIANHALSLSVQDIDITRKGLRNWKTK